MVNNKSFYRWEIWMADCSFLKIKNHYVIIVSNFKMNNRGKNVHCCLITSKLNNKNSRVSINLYEPSEICCESILTFSKSNLLYKLTDIKNDIYTQLEIEKCLEQELQLSKKFVNTDIDLLENYLMKGINSMNDESQLVNLRNNICNLAVENKYEETIELCNKSIEIASNSLLENRNDFLWHSMYHRSLMFSKLGNHESSLLDARDSLKYVPSLRNTISPKYGYSLWRIANCYESLGDIDSAVQIYKNLNIFYKKSGKGNLRITVLFNIYKAKGKINKMQTIINILEKMNFNERNTDKTKEKLILEMKEDLKQFMQKASEI